MTKSTKVYTPEQIAGLRKTILDEIRLQFPYETPRQNQVLVIYNIVKSYLEGKKFFILEASTGFGKSVAGVTALKVIASLFPNENDEGQMITPTSLVCTRTKALQDQYSKDFGDFVSLWSASGYSCNRDPNSADAYYGSHECDKRLCFFYNDCNYRLAREDFQKSRRGILNYAFFMHYAKHKPQLLLLDEAHNLEKVLADHLHIRLNPVFIRGALEKLERLDIATGYHTRTVYERLSEITSVYTTQANWFDVIREKSGEIIKILFAVLEKYKVAKDLIDQGQLLLAPEQRKSLLFNGNMIDSLYSKLYRLTGSSVEWVISERNSNESIDLKPVSLVEEAGSMFSRSDFIILMSATICGIPLFCETLGIKQQECGSISIPSSVPLENRRVVSVGLKGMTFSNKLELLPVYVQVMDQLIDTYGSKVRGIIHSVTFENAEYIVKHSKHKKRMIVPQTEDVLRVKKLMMRKPDTLLVGPNFTEGIDLPGELSEIQFLFKVPYLFLGDQWVKRKAQISQKWYNKETLNTTVQACGRSVRSDKDSCITFILDGKFNDLIDQNRELVPVWFLQSIVRT